MPDKHCDVEVHAVLHCGTGDAVGLGDGDLLGVGLGDGLGDGVGLGVETAKEREQALVTAAAGLLEGAFGATG